MSFFGEKRESKLQLHTFEVNDSKKIYTLCMCGGGSKIITIIAYFINTKKAKLN